MYYLGLYKFFSYHREVNILQLEIINKFSEIEDNYDVFIFSLMSIIDGEKVFSLAKTALEQLKASNKKVIILANSPLRSRQLMRQLSELGISSDLYDGVLSSGEVVYHELANKSSPFFKALGTCYYHIGRSYNSNDWVDIGYIPVTSLEKAEFIIVTSAKQKQDSIEKYLPFLRNAANIALPMLCVNPDKNLDLSGSDDIGAGSIAARYEAMGGLVKYRGKPDKDMFAYCLEAFPHLNKKRFVVVANSFTADIKGASNLDLDSILIATGSHARELGLALGKPLSSQTVNELSRHYGVFPKYILPEVKY